MYLERKYLTERGKQDICLFNYCSTQYGNSVNPNPEVGGGMIWPGLYNIGYIASFLELLLSLKQVQLGN